MYAMNEWEIRTSGDFDLNMSTMNDQISIA